MITAAQPCASISDTVIEDIKAVADPETVAECLGIDTKRRGKNLSILCPCHDDQHYGSCYLTRKGFKCYACGASGDVMDLVQRTKNCSFLEACEYVGDIYGIKTDVSIPTPKRKKLLDSKYLSLIGLNPDTEKVYIDKAIIDAPIDPDFQLGPGQRLKWFPSGSDSEPDYYVLQEVASSNPLRDLLETDEAEYHALICRKASEAADTYRDMIKFVQNPARFFNEHCHSPKSMLMMYCSELVCREVGMLPWIHEMERRIRQCENLRIEHSSVQKDVTTREKIPLGSVFGKLKRGGISF